MTQLKSRQLPNYILMALFIVTSFYAYTISPSPTNIETQVYKTFLLSTSVSAVVILVYATVRHAGLVGKLEGRVLEYDIRIPAAIAGICLAFALAYGFLKSMNGWYFVFIPALMAFSILAIRGIYPFRGTMGVPTVDELREDKIVKLVTSRPRLKNIADARTKKFSGLLINAGIIGNPYTMVAESLAYTIITALVAIPVALILALLVWKPLIIIAVAPIFPYAMPEMSLKDKAAERGGGVERELPFFSILVNVLGSAGVPLYSIMTGLIETKIFHYIKREALLVKRDVTIFGMNPIDSFEKLASTHPSKKLGTFLYGYSSKVRSGGDIPLYLSGESGNLLRELEDSWTRYSTRVGIIGSMMITMFGVIPMLLLVVGMFSAASSVYSLVLYTALGVPLFTIILVYMAARMQPQGDEPLVGKAGRSILLSLPGLAVGLLSGIMWIGLAAMLFVFSTVYGYSVVEQRREMNEMDTALPEFMKDMMEFKRQEYDLTKAILNISAHNKYTPAFDKALAEFAAQLKIGTPMDQITVDPRSRLARTVFFVLGQMALSGGGTVDTFYQLTTYTSRVVEMRQNTTAEMRPYMFMSLISPLLLAFGVAFISTVLGQFSHVASSGTTVLHDKFMIGVITPQLKEVSDFLIVVSSAALGIISSKMVDFTVKNTLRASVNIIIATVVTYLLNQLNILSLLHLAL